MTKKEQQIVIVGDSAIAEIAYEYFTYDSAYDVAAFTVNEAYLKKDSLFGKPVVPWERISNSHPADKYRMFVALGYNQLNRLRARFFREAKQMGYTLPSYVSSHAFVWRNVTMGENCFIFENNVVQPFVTIGDNVTMWSGNHIGHHSHIGSHVFFASHVVLSGFCEVEDYSFFGVNATIANNVRVRQDDLVGAGAMILRDTEANKIYGAKMTVPAEKSARDYFKVDAAAE